MNHNEAADNNTLSNLKPINSSININSICTKDSYISHVKVIEKAQVQKLAS